MPDKEKIDKALRETGVKLERKDSKARKRVAKYGEEVAVPGIKRGIKKYKEETNFEGSNYGPETELRRPPRES